MIVSVMFVKRFDEEKQRFIVEQDYYVCERLFTSDELEKFGLEHNCSVSQLLIGSVVSAENKEVVHYCNKELYDLELKMLKELKEVDDSESFCGNIDCVVKGECNCSNVDSLVCEDKCNCGDTYCPIPRLDVYSEEDREQDILFEGDDGDDV